MFTAKVKDKRLENGILTVDVEFTDGTTSIIKSVVPQDEAGLKFFVKGELNTLNAAPQIDTDYGVGDEIDVADPVAPTPTAAEVARGEWFANYQKLEDVQKLIDLGVLTGNETKVVALRDKVKTDFKPEYINLI